jgi:demethylmenaquinone methyltransferase/2-methoxy-6-polyprenyl-1,4-benzoquinol methylase
MSSGLGEDWSRILDDLKVLVPIYERGNMILSLGRSGKLRRMAISSGLPGSGLVVDVGSGPGSMSVEAKRMNPGLEAVLVDPLPEMLALASAQVELKEAGMVVAVYEYLPFRDRSFSGYLAGFTLRDARNRGDAVRETTRVLADGGSATVLDLGRPDSAVKRVFVAAYWRLLAPLLLFLFLRGRGKPFGDIYITLKKLPSNSDIISLFSERFAEVIPRKLMLDGVLVIVARGPRHAGAVGRDSATGLK